MLGGIERGQLGDATDTCRPLSSSNIILMRSINLMPILPTISSTYIAICNMNCSRRQIIATAKNQCHSPTNHDFQHQGTTSISKNLPHYDYTCLLKTQGLRINLRHSLVLLLGKDTTAMLPKSRFRHDGICH